MKIHEIRTPAYVLDEEKLVSNLEILADVQERAGCKILLAQKAFSMFSVYPLIGKYLAGTAASGLYEARLGAEEMGKETHVFAAAYRPEEVPELARICDHIIFNSVPQLLRYRNFIEGVQKPAAVFESASEVIPAALESVVPAEAQAEAPAEVQAAAEVSACGRKKISIGLRINPECSTQDHAIYDPCAPGSRLGVTREALERAAGDVSDLSGQGAEDCAGCVSGQGAEDCAGCVSGQGMEDFVGCVSGRVSEGPDGRLRALLRNVEGLHVHTLCEQNADALEKTLAAVEEKFGDLLPYMKWLNLGGGHHITREDYDRELLIRLIRGIKERYDLEIYLEPGEAIALNAGYLVTDVMDAVENAGIRTLILDASAACHMPDVLEMPYRPRLLYPCECGRVETDRVACVEANQPACGEANQPACGETNLPPDGKTDQSAGREECFSGLPPVRRAGEAGEKAYTYRLSSCTCLAGDITGDYSFDREILPGDRLYLEDMAIYSMVKNNTFNGQRLPDIVVMDAEGECRLQRSFGYEDFKMRLS